MMRKWVVPILGFVLMLGAGCKQKPLGKDAATAAPRGAASSVQRTVSIYVPCGLILPVRETIAAFEQEHPQVDVQGTFDNAITLARRIKDKGERPELFVSPGEREMKALEDANLLDPQSKRRFGRFELTVIVPKPNPAGITEVEDLAKAETISCPNPEHNSVGWYAEQALKKMGLWDQLGPKMVLTDFAIESHKLVASGKAQAGLAFKHCPLDTAPEKLSKSKVGVACDFPLDSYPVATCIVATLRDAKNRQDAEAFSKFLVSPEGQAILVANGLPALAETEPAASARGPSRQAGDAAGKAKVTVQAFYPDNEGHAVIKQLVEQLGRKYPGQVSAEFVDFTSDEGFERWREAGLTCGAILINGEQTVKIKEAKGTREVTFMMGMGGEWTQADLEAAVVQAVAEAYP